MVSCQMANENKRISPLRNFIGNSQEMMLVAAQSSPQNTRPGVMGVGIMAKQKGPDIP